MFTCSLAAAIGVHFIAFKPSPAEHLRQSLAEITGPDTTVSLDGCTLLLTTETLGPEGSSIARTRMVLQADLRNYNFKTVHFTPASNSFGLRIDRGPVDDRMMAQAAKVIDAGGERMKQLFSDGQTAKEILETQGGSIFFSLMAKVGVAKDGSQNLIAHEDAPDFFQFARAVEALPSPSSYLSTTTFKSGEISAETLLTGKIVAVPFLQFSLKSEDQAKELAHAFSHYAGKNDCK